MRAEPVQKFTCPHCLDLVASRVLETRDERRRRECLGCGGTFATREEVTSMRDEPLHYPESGDRRLPF